MTGSMYVIPGISIIFISTSFFSKHLQKFYSTLCVYSCSCSIVIAFSSFTLFQKFSISELLILKKISSLTCSSSNEMLVTLWMAKLQ